MLEATPKMPTSLLQTEAAATTRSCPGGIACGDLANNMIWNQSCWDCLAEYQEFFCEKCSLADPEPMYVDACAREGQFRGAFCKKFAEVEPPRFYQDCMFDGSEYKQIYCEKKKLNGEYTTACAVDNNVGESYCQAFAPQLTGYTECHGWPGYMFLYCNAKADALNWDATCANHVDSGAAYCEDFALDPHAEIKADCVKYASYINLLCEVKANHNVSMETCASDRRCRGAYCGKMALQKNGIQACWAVEAFNVAYCNEINWPLPACEGLAGDPGISHTAAQDTPTR